MYTVNLKTIVLILVISIARLSRGVRAGNKPQYKYKHYDPGNFVASIGSIVPEQARRSGIVNHLIQLSVTTPYHELTDIQVKDDKDDDPEQLDELDASSQFYQLIVKHLQPASLPDYSNSTVEGAFVGCSRKSCSSRKKSCNNKMAAGKTSTPKPHHHQKRCKNKDEKPTPACRMQSRILKMVGRQIDTPKDWLLRIDKYLDGYNMSILIVGGDYQQTLVNGDIIGYIGNGQPTSQSTHVANIAHIFTV